MATQTTKQDKQALGKLGEAFATTYIEKKGWSILARNWRCPYGEIDIAAQDGNTIVIVEVRTRRGKNALDIALASINPAKQSRLSLLAEYFQESHPHLSELSIRVDVIAIAQQADGFMQVEHITDALSW